MLRRLSPVVVVIALSGCTPPWKQAYVRGESAIAAARYDDAAVAFSESCELDGAASDACVRAKTLRRRAVKDAVADAEKICRDDLSRCLERLRTARGLAVHERALGKQVEAVLDDASARHVQRCEAAPERTYQSTMIAARCIAAHEEAVGTAAHRRRVDEALARLADGLSPAAGSDDDSDDDVAFAAVRHGLAHCYAPTPARASAVGEARRQIVSRHQAHVAVTDLQGLPRSFVDVVCRSEAVDRAPLSCGPAKADGRVVLDVGASLVTGRVGHGARDTDKVVRYVHHIEERPNPEYPRVRDRVASLQDQTRAASTTKDAADIDCDGAEDELRVAGYCYDCDARVRKDRLCARKDAAERALREVKSLLDDEERRLRQTDEVLRIPHYADFAFTETRHTWEQPVRVEARCAELARATGAFSQPALVTSRTIRFEDDTHVGFGPAGLAEDPLVEPTGAMFAERATGIAREELVSFVSRCLEAFAADKGRCGDEVDCFQRRALYRGEDPVTATIGSFADAVDRVRPDLPRFPCRAQR